MDKWLALILLEHRKLHFSYFFCLVSIDCCNWMKQLLVLTVGKQAAKTKEKRSMEVYKAEP